MKTQHMIAAADPARALPRHALELDVDAVLHELSTQPGPVPEPRRTPAALPRRRRLDLALAAVVTAFLAAVAFLPASFTHDSSPGRSTGTSSTQGASSAEARATANALLDEIAVPAAAVRASAPPNRYLSIPRVGLACKGTVSAQPRYWIVPNTTLQAVAEFLTKHRPASADRLPFNHPTASGVAAAFTAYRPAVHSEVVIALASTPAGVGIRADADVTPGSTCLNRGS